MPKLVLPDGLTPVETRRAHLIWRRYRLSWVDYCRLLDHQGRRCATCSVTFDRRAACVDHDHRTGVVRGLLCTKCNRKIQERFERYLEDPPALHVLRHVVPPTLDERAYQVRQAKRVARATRRPLDRALRRALADGTSHALIDLIRRRFVQEGASVARLCADYRVSRPVLTEVLGELAETGERATYSYRTTATGREEVTVKVH